MFKNSLIAQFTSADPAALQQVLDLMKSLGIVTTQTSVATPLVDPLSENYRDVVLYDPDGFQNEMVLVPHVGDRMDAVGAEVLDLADFEQVSTAGVCVALSSEYPKVGKYPAQAFLLDEEFFSALVGEANLRCTSGVLVASFREQRDDEYRRNWFTLRVPADFKFDFEG